MKARLITAVRALPGSRLQITWDNGVEAVIDLKPELKRAGPMKRLADTRRFNRAAVGEWGHSVTWGDDLELGAD